MLFKSLLATLGKPMQVKKMQIYFCTHLYFLVCVCICIYIFCICFFVFVFVDANPADIVWALQGEQTIESTAGHWSCIQTQTQWQTQKHTELQIQILIYIQILLDISNCADHWVDRAGHAYTVSIRSCVDSGQRWARIVYKFHYHPISTVRPKPWRL